MAKRSDLILSASKQVKEQYLKDLLAKMNAGEKITRAELDLISLLESDIAGKKPDGKTHGGGLITDVKGAAAFFGVTGRTIQLWTKNGNCPKLRHGMYDLKAVFDWWKENISTGDESKEAQDVKLEYWAWKLEEKKIKVQTLQGQLRTEEQIVKEWAARMSEITTGLQALSRRLPPMIDGKSKAEQQQIIDNEIWKLRDNYCRTGQFTPPSDGK